MHRWSFVRASCASLLLAIAAGGCSGELTRHEPVVNPNEFPAGYRNELVQYLTTVLSDPDEFRGASISEPVLKPVGLEPRYVVCLRIAGRNAREKMLIYFGGRINQYLDAPREQCGAAVYQPFAELALARPQPGAAPR